MPRYCFNTRARSRSTGTGALARARRASGRGACPVATAQLASAVQHLFRAELQDHLGMRTRPTRLPPRRPRAADRAETGPARPGSDSPRRAHRRARGAALAPPRPGRPYQTTGATSTPSAASAAKTRWSLLFSAIGLPSTTGSRSARQRIPILTRGRPPEPRRDHRRRATCARSRPRRPRGSRARALRIHCR